MFRNMVTSLFKHDRIRTTETKAKELKRWADQMITLAKQGDLHARRRALAIMMEKDVVHKLFEEAPQRFGAINGGYTRVVKLGRRPGDAATISLVELVGAQAGKKKSKAAKDKKSAAPQKPAAARETPAEKAPPVDVAPAEVPETDSAAKGPDPEK
jgi:large subunit ribosomal protein L17